MRKILLVVLLLCSTVFAQNPYRIFNSFNAGELWEGLSAREDLAKYQSGCSVMENLIPLPQGGVEKRSGTKYIAEVKTSSLSTRLLPFEYSTTQSYVLETGNQYMRFFTNGAPVLDGIGTDDLSGVDGGALVAHWKLDEEEENTTVVNDDDAGTYDGTATANTGILHEVGKVGSGCFDLDGQYTVEIADAAAFSFTDNSNDTAFSIVCWGFVTQQSSDVQNLLSKWRDQDTAKEWRFSLSSEKKLQLHLADTQADLSGDRVAQWKLNEAAADKIVLDDTANNHDGLTQTDNTTVLSETGKIETCLNFGAADAVVITSDAATLSFDDSVTLANPFSIAAWVYVTEVADYQKILTKWETTNDTEWSLQLEPDQRLTFILNDQDVYKNALIVTNTALSIGWHFVVGTYNGVGGASASAGLNLYVDGDLLTTVTRNTQVGYAAMEDTTTKVVIGASYSAVPALQHFFGDKIDNVVLFDVELTQANILTLYNSGAGTETMPTREISAVADTALLDGWHFLACTYSAPADETAAADGIILYVDGVAVDSTATNDADYTAMQGAGEAIRIGSQNNSADNADEKFWGDKIDEISVFGDVLTPTEVASLYSTSPYEIETPYLTVDLFDLKYEQSADVLFITHPDYETRKLSRLVNTLWTITVIGIEDGPFRTQNSDVADFITASGTTGSVTLTATGHTPFALGTTAGHQPSGSVTTSKSQTGALFKLVHPTDNLESSDTLEDDYTANQTEGVSWHSCGTLYKDAEWTWTTDGTWLGTVEVQRNYTIGASDGDDGWETVLPYSGLTTARNVTTTGTEDDGDADYRVIFTDDTSGTVISYFTTDQTEVVGIVEITSVTSSTEAIGTVVKTLASTDATYKWAEGAWSNYRGWPATSTFFEDRLMFGGNTAQPDTIWGSVTSDYENMTAGANDDDAVIFTLSSRQVNVIEWLIGKDKVLIGTSGAEWTLDGASDEPLTPSSVKATQQSTYGSANLQATLANESVLFFQRGAEKMRELAYNWELDSYVAPDMTILSKEVTDGGIVDSAFQRTPDSILWCVRDDGELPIFSYERKENVTAWSRLITEDGTSDSDFESVAVINGDPEDEVWVVVKRIIDSNTVRYIEQFQPRDFGSDPCDAFYVDCGATYTTDVNVITDLTWLEGESVVALADGAIVSGLTVTSSTITLGGVYQQVQIGLPYIVQLRTMPLSWVAQGQTIHGRIKRISEVIARWLESGDFSIGKDVDNLQTYSITGQTTSQDRKTFPPGYDREGQVFIYQKSPEPLTVINIAVEFNVD